MSEKGIFIISLDFELNWGVHDVFKPGQYEENLLGARKAIPETLKLFRQFDIHATWATVGMLFFENKQRLMDNLPTVFPSYANSAFSPYLKLDAVGENEVDDPIHYGASLISKIASTPHQEIGSHTFSHYYCLEEGQTIEEFEGDLVASKKTVYDKGYTLQSLVFPRNQTNESYLQVCKKHGIQSYRGNEKSRVYKASGFHNEGISKRVLRLADHYFNLFGHHTYRISDVECEPIINLPSSRFLRPYNKHFKRAESLRLNRIKKSIYHAAKNGEVFHLWWHPHNFGGDLDENLEFLLEILKYVAEMREEYGFQSLNMGETSAYIRQFQQKGKSQDEA